MADSHYITGVEFKSKDGNVLGEMDFVFISMNRFNVNTYDLVLGECKGFLPFQKEQVQRIDEIASRFRSRPLLCFATLKDEFDNEEKDLFRGLVREGKVVIPLTRNELDPFDLWERCRDAPRQHIASMDDLAVNACHWALS